MGKGVCLFVLFLHKVLWTSFWLTIETVFSRSISEPYSFVHLIDLD